MPHERELHRLISNAMAISSHTLPGGSLCFSKKEEIIPKELLPYLKVNQAILKCEFPHLPHQDVELNPPTFNNKSILNIAY